MRQLGKQEPVYEIQKGTIERSSPFSKSYKILRNERPGIAAIRLAWEIPRYDKFLVLVNAVGVADGRIGGGQTRPGRRPPQVGPCQRPQSIALADPDG